MPRITLVAMEFFLILPVLLISIVVHEVAHAWVALKEGDDTAYMLGRITLNPIPHMDPVGSLIVPLLLFFFGGGMLFGWAKPVPVNPRNFRNYKWGDIRVSLAGIVSNLMLAVMFLGLIIVALKLAPVAGSFEQTVGLVGRMARYGLYLNLILAVFNLAPIPPLDGSHVVYHLLPPGLGARYRDAGRYGLTILMLVVMMAPGALRFLLWPVAVLMSVADRFIQLWI